MQAWFNMPTHQFVDQLRDIAVKAGARPAIIDCLDAIVNAETEEEIEERIGKDCAHEWRMARRQFCVSLDEAALGLTPEQYVKVLEIVDRMEPEV